MGELALESLLLGFFASFSHSQNPVMASAFLNKPGALLINPASGQGFYFQLFPNLLICSTKTFRGQLVAAFSS